MNSTSRQAQNTTDESQESLEPDVARDPDAAWQYLEATELESFGPMKVLQKALIIRSVVIMNSSFATRSRSATAGAGAPDYQNIGAGLQGIVYERMGCQFVCKKEQRRNPGRRLQDEFAMHRKVWDAFAKYNEFSGDLRVPKPYDFIPKDELSRGELPRMPADDRQPSDIATMERILPLPKVVRKAMIKSFYPATNYSCDEHVVTQILNETANKHCLARVYLGEKTVALSKESFTLRNFPLTRDIMEVLDLDMVYFATMIGSAYAIMHWAANITGDDVEFVLGTSASGPDDFQSRETHLYLLDFGQCEAVNMDEDQDDIFQALKGSMVLRQNQLYLPHPKRSARLYRAWKSAYLRTAHKIIRSECLPFDPKEFCQAYEEYLEDFDP
ncbi:hypothetical protein F4824DRAFT_515629 [Ustulina deusta]|nr:hypothetical protein F4824DRAFT_515629 [Ustulina deusta]